MDADRNHHSTGRPGTAPMPSPSTYEKTVPAAGVAATHAPPLLMLWRRAGQVNATQYNGFSGCLWLPGGRPPLRHRSGSQFCLVSAYPNGHPQADIPDRVTACEQYLNRTIIVPNMKVYLHYLRPDRDSNAGPTA
jgi:hypothetical protein